LERWVCNAVKQESKVEKARWLRINDLAQKITAGCQSIFWKGGFVIQLYKVKVEKAQCLNPEGAF
jgi:hypothetical protein